MIRPRNEASIGEKSLYLINDDSEWKKLKEHLRSSGIVTNHAAKLIIIEYLNRREVGEDQEFAASNVFGMKSTPDRSPGTNGSVENASKADKNIAEREMDEKELPQKKERSHSWMSVLRERFPGTDKTNGNMEMNEDESISNISGYALNETEKINKTSSRGDMMEKIKAARANMSSRHIGRTRARSNIF